MIFYIVTALLLGASFVADRRKTVKSLKIAWKKFSGIAPMFVVMLILVSVSLYLLPHEVLREYLGREDLPRGMCIAMGVGSIALMPGFIVFPLCGILREQGVPFMVLSGFTTTLMMVGLLSLPVEKAYFGLKVALVRNGIGLLTAFVVAVATGLLFGEVAF